MQLRIIVPVIMSCALLWWIGHRLSWRRRLLATAITLIVIVLIVLIERSGL